ncbi:MAG: outer membrane lipoprotein carrier protein LolA [Holophagales bacterium]|nr:outer membrane lipoprotein carrier protein LolA [Holophagales bacterium]MYF94019.1 outer membrane lipoprotein carrier protein LolA [Holophagales bacterium]
MSRVRAAALAIVVASAFGLAAAPAPAADDPWQVLDGFRRGLEDSGPLSAGFVQTFVPFGFAPEDGETERGSLAIDLPGCLRWDYSPPFEKAFLLCGRTVHHWNPGEPVGQRYDLSEQPAPGLDFFLLSASDLRDRYEAELDAAEANRLRLVLRPLEPSEDVVEVQVVIDAEDQRLRELTYQDAQRNENRFVVGDYRSGAPPGRFEPPPGIDWEEP